MKKLLTIVSLAMGAIVVHGQGFIIVQSTASNITTNGTGTNPGENGTTTGKTGTGSSAYYYALLFDAGTPASSSPTAAGWTQATQNGGAALALNNYVVAGAISGTGTSAGVAVDMAAGTTYNVELVGWSASLGTSLTQVLAEEAAGWIGVTGYFGYTSEGTMTPFATAGAGDPSIFPTAFPVGSLVLNGVSQGVPEPASIAMAGLGGLALLGLRRKK